MRGQRSTGAKLTGGTRALTVDQQLAVPDFVHVAIAMARAVETWHQENGPHTAARAVDSSQTNRSTGWAKFVNSTALNTSHIYLRLRLHRRSCVRCAENTGCHAKGTVRSSLLIW